MFEFYARVVALWMCEAKESERVGHGSFNGGEIPYHMHSY